MTKNFSILAKTEVLNSPIRKRSEKIALLSAICHGGGTLGINSGGMRLIIKLENNQIKEFIDNILFSLYKQKSIIDEDNNIVIQGEFLQILLIECGILKIKEQEDNSQQEQSQDVDKIKDNIDKNTTSASSEPEYYFNSGIDDSITLKDTSRIAFIKGAFLGCGSISIKTGYHLEFVVSTAMFARDLAILLEEFDIIPSIVERKDKYVIYLKDSDKISDLLALMGAVKAVLSLNNMIASRHVSQTVNRKLNCDMANIEKAVQSATVEVQAINKIKKHNDFDKLDDKLKLAAMARLDNPEATLSELADILQISKSGIRHRLKKIIDRSSDYDN